ncbi:MAG: nucleoside-diphosphate sugar epimerase, partial [Kiritimatiellaeota bacterium]|nr:nucleoside-diphosphate sugar epimerase [Kiritimatiellota bacterium]
NGSLPAGFLERLQKRQPWSCPLGIRRFFVSPREAGELCLLASIIAPSGGIVFPRLDENTDMISFDQVARDLLATLGMEPDACATEREAVEKMARLAPGPAKKWPVYFFESDTSGEKPFEEFHTDGETLDLETFDRLGVVTNAPRRDIAEIAAMCGELRTLFASPDATKEQVVKILGRHLPGFAHIETGKNLDQKM